MRPVLFKIPLGFVSLPLYSYGLMLALSLIVGWYLTLSLCERDGMERQTMGRCYMWTAVAALAGARLLYVLTNL
jgi:phosphatidylglycerol:prolipoprotein diacylglycerol transferase